jgi:hypothetical protein
MRHDPTFRPVIDLPRSTLIYGQGEAAMSMLAAGLATKISPGFGWANCSGSTKEWDRTVRETLESGSPGRQVHSVGPEELERNRVGDFDAERKDRFELHGTTGDQVL